MFGFNAAEVGGKIIGESAKSKRFSRAGREKKKKLKNPGGVIGAATKILGDPGSIKNIVARKANTGRRAEGNNGIILNAVRKLTRKKLKYTMRENER